MQDNLRKPVNIDQRIAILCDGNNIEIGIHEMYSKLHVINFDEFVPNILKGRKLSYLHYFREGKSISKKLAERLQKNFFGTVTPCHKSADIALTIEAVQLADKVDTIILCSGDSDYIPLIEHLKSRGIRVEIAATQNGLSPYMSRKADAVYMIERNDCFALYDKREVSDWTGSTTVEDTPSEATMSNGVSPNTEFVGEVRMVCNNGLKSSDVITDETE
jgi:uncharacterized LabA/DUF88 family protein